MRARTPLALAGAAALAFASLLVASPASAVAPANPVIVTPGVQEYINTSSFTAEWEAVVGTNGPSQYEYELSGGSATDVDGAFLSTVAAGVTTELTAAIPVLADGSYYFHVRAGDDDGFLTWADSGYRVFMIDTVAPEVALTSPAPAGGTYALAFDVEEINPFTWVVTLDGTEVASGSKETFGSPTSLTADVDLSGLAVGDHTITVTATDSAGNATSAGAFYAVAAPPVAPAPAPAPPTLPATGVDAKAPLLIGGLLFVTGAFLLIVRRYAR